MLLVHEEILHVMRFFVKVVKQQKIKGNILEARVKMFWKFELKNNNQFKMKLRDNHTTGSVEHQHYTSM